MTKTKTWICPECGDNIPVYVLISEHFKVSHPDSKFNLKQIEGIKLQ